MAIAGLEAALFLGLLEMDSSTLYMLLGFILAAYAVVGNDALQTLGTLIASNREVPWYWLWAGASIVLILVLGYGWWMGDIAWGRLDRIPPPQRFHIWHALAPVVVLILTRFGIPISTTFLVLSVFASGPVIEKMVVKSLLGWGAAAIAAFTIWSITSRWLDEHRPVVDERHRKWWRYGQWVATSLLWSQWLIQDMANIAVFLPRNLGLDWFLLAMMILVAGLAYIFWSGGGRIQRIVLEKTGARFTRSATIIDLVYAGILLVFKEVSNIPMSTTWVFIGVLAGRELAIEYQHRKLEHLDIVFPMLARDFTKTFFGAAVSVLAAYILHYLIRLADANSY